MAAAVGVGEGMACVQPRAANVDWLSLRCKIEWVARHGPMHLLCPLAPHVLGRAGLKQLGMQRNVDDRDLAAAFDLEEVYRASRAVVAVGVYYMFSENLQGSAPWPPEYFNGVSEAVCSEKVRFVDGVFECPVSAGGRIGPQLRRSGSFALRSDFQGDDRQASEVPFQPCFLSSSLGMQIAASHI